MFSVDSEGKGGNNIFREKTIECAASNGNRHKNGRRYDYQLMQFSIYLRINGGPKVYKTLKNNDYNGMPSIHSTNRAMWKNKKIVIEGVLRHVELADFMKSLNLPMYVSLSEDATSVTGKIEYSPKLNQIIGIVPPLNEKTGMPVPLTFASTSATATESILLDQKAEISNNVNVIMAQPLASGIPAFCLLVFGGNGKFTKQDVSNRWSHVTKKLAEVGIKVLSFASDSDSRYNGCMRDVMLSAEVDESSGFPNWFRFDCSTAEYFPVQDTVHIGTKLRNRILKKNIRFGEHEISLQHLVIMMNTFSRDKHGLHPTHLDKNDRMNFISVQKITDPRVIQLLESGVEVLEQFYTSKYWTMFCEHSSICLYHLWIESEKYGSRLSF